MAYRSPLHILQSLDIRPEELTLEGIQRLRKKILAEFNLNTSVTIDLHGRQYTKDELLKTIDALREVDNLPVHIAIFENKQLLSWLESPISVQLPIKQLHLALDQKPLDEIYLAILQEAARDYFSFYLKKREFIHVNRVLEFFNYFDKTEQYTFYNIIYPELQYIIESLEQAIGTPRIKQDKKTFEFIGSYDWTDFLNWLPDEFEGTRNNYCRNAINYTVAIQRLDKPWTCTISNQLTKTKCDDSLKKTILSNHDIYRNNSKETKSEDSNAWLTIKVILFVLFMISRIAACSR